MKILEILEIDKNGRALIRSHSNSELVEAIGELQEFVQKDKLEYKRGWRDRAAQSDLENRTCDSCKHFEEGICYSNKICLMNGGEHILTTKEFSCNQWVQNRYVKREGLK